MRGTTQENTQKAPLGLVTSKSIGTRRTGTAGEGNGWPRHGIKRCLHGSMGAGQPSVEEPEKDRAIEGIL